MRWVPTLEVILGAPDDDIDPTRASGPPWVMFESGLSGTVERVGEPAPSNGDWNHVTIWRWLREGEDALRIQVVRARFDFYIGPGDFELSPARQAQQLVEISNSQISGIQVNPMLTAESFRTTARVIQQVLDWVPEGRDHLSSLYDGLGDGDSGFQGSAAQALVWALRVVDHQVDGVGSAITQPDSWPVRLEESATAVDTFKTALTQAWADFTAYRYHDPNWLVGEVVNVILAEIASQPAADDVGAAANPAAPWVFDFSAQGLGSYDLSHPAGWEALNGAMKGAWNPYLEALENAALAASQALIASFTQLDTSFSRGVVPPAPFPPPPGMLPPRGDGPELTDVGDGTPDVDGPDGDGPDGVTRAADVPFVAGADGPDVPSAGGDGVTEPPSATGPTASGAIAPSAFVGGGGALDGSVEGGSTFEAGFEGPDLGFDGLTGTVAATGPAGVGGFAATRLGLGLFAVSPGAVGATEPDEQRASGSPSGAQSDGFDLPPLGADAAGTVAPRAVSAGEIGSLASRAVGQPGFGDPGFGASGLAKPDTPPAGAVIGPLGAAPPGTPAPGSLSQELAGQGLRVLGAGSAGGSVAVQYAGPGGILTGGAGGLGMGGIGGAGAVDGAGPPYGHGSYGAPMPFVPMGTGGTADGGTGRGGGRGVRFTEDQTLWGTEPARVAGLVGAEDEQEVSVRLRPQPVPDEDSLDDTDPFVSESRSRVGEYWRTS